MKIHRALPCIAVLHMSLGAALAADVSSQQQPVVIIDAGRIAGVQQGEANAFLGIPYAAPPVAERRWQPPASVTAWNETRNATAFGATCPQPRTPFAPGKIQSEDCLFLNVWTPKNAVGKKLPVMVSIHGGAYMLGSGDLPNTSAFSRDGVVLVSMNYRLGRLGFFAHPALTKENPDGPLGNYGVMDLVAALKWVNKNIAAFGGDPTRVTIFGCSAGGTFTNMLLTTPEARGLFHGAIAQSDPFNEPWPRLRKISTTGKDTAEERGSVFAATLGLNDATVEQLRALSVEQIINAPENASVAHVVPIVDGTYVVDRGPDAFAAGKAARVPYINSTNSWEASLITGNNATGAETVASLGPNRDKVVALYPEEVRNDPVKLGQYVFNDIRFLAPQRTAARLAADHGQPTWTMRFNYIPQQLRANNPPGATHCSDLAYQLEAFERDAARFTPTDAEWKIAKTLHRYWINFAKTGNPNSAGLTHWPRFTSQQKNMLVINNDGPTVTVNQDAAHMDVVEDASLAVMRAAP